MSAMKIAYILTFAYSDRDKCWPELDILRSTDEEQLRELVRRLMWEQARPGDKMLMVLHDQMESLDVDGVLRAKSEQEARLEEAEEKAQYERLRKKYG